MVRYLTSLKKKIQRDKKIWGGWMIMFLNPSFLVADGQ